MSRSVTVVPTCASRAFLALASVLALALAAGCGGAGGVDGGPGGPGGSGVRDPYFPRAGNGGYDVTHYDLDLTYEPGTETGTDTETSTRTSTRTPSDHLTGTATITARATQDLSAFDLDFEGLDVDGVAVDGKNARWNRSGQELTVRPRDDLDADRTFRVTVRYSGTPVTITDPDGSEEGWLRTEDGALALGEPTGSMAWFPGNHHPSDKATYELTMTVPKGLRAVSNGELVSERGAGDRRTAFTWRTAEPMASHVATVAVGAYDIHRSTTADGLPVYVAVDPAVADASRKVLAGLPGIVEWGTDTFGPYPFSSAGAIVERAGDSGYALETQNRPVIPGAPDTGLLVHELAHQWYGNSVTPKTWRDMWLNEGFATYAEWLWREEHGGDSAQKTFDALYDHGDQTYEDLWSFPPAKPTSAAHLSDSPVYQRGAMVLHRIRRTIGDPAFRALLRDWPTTHRHGNADTADFTAYVEKRAPGKNFDAIWTDWLYGDGKPPPA